MTNAVLNLNRPIFGVDVSDHQEPFGAAGAAGARAAGLRFAWVKATEGANWTAKRTAVHLEQLDGAGIACGVYHYARPDLRKDPAPEVEHFARAIEKHSRRGAKLRPVIDVEEPNSKADRIEHGAEYLAAFVDGLQSAVGVTPVVYTGYFWWLRHLAGCDWPMYFGSAPVWMARHPRGEQPQTPERYSAALQSEVAKALPMPTGAKLCAWQYTAHGTVPAAYPRRLDLNVSDPAHFARAVWPGATVAAAETAGDDNARILTAAAAAAALAAAT